MFIYTRKDKNNTVVVKIKTRANNHLHRVSHSTAYTWASFLLTKEKKREKYFFSRKREEKTKGMLSLKDFYKLEYSRNRFTDWIFSRKKKVESFDLLSSMMNNG